MSINIKNLISSAGWRELTKELDNRVAQIKEEILDEAAKSSPKIDTLRKLSADREAILELKELPATLLNSAEEIETL